MLNLISFQGDEGRMVESMASGTHSVDGIEELNTFERLAFVALLALLAAMSVLVIHLHLKLVSGSR